MERDREDRQLRIAIEETHTCLRPRRWKSLADVLVGRQIYQTLVNIGPELQIEGSLAETIERLGNRWIFHLREGVNFHDGTPLEAGHVAAQLRESVIWSSGLASVVNGIEVLDRRTVAIQLRVPFAPLLDRLAAPAAVITKYQPTGDQLFGTGKYIPAEAAQGNVLDLRRTDSGPDLRFIPYRDGTRMWEALCAGEVDVAYECPYRFAKGENSPPGIEVTTRPSLSVNLLVFNVEARSGLGLGERRAIRDGIDKRTLFEKINLGVGEIACSPISPASPFFRPLPEVEKVERRRRRLTIEVLATQGYTGAWLEEFSEQLRRANIVCNILELPFSELQERIDARKFQCVLIGLTASADPDPIMYEVFHSSGRTNISGFCSRNYDRLIENARASSSFEERVALYAEANQELLREVPAVFLRHGASILARRSEIRGLEPHPMNWLDFQHAVRAHEPDRMGSSR